MLWDMTGEQSTRNCVSNQGLAQGADLSISEQILVNDQILCGNVASTNNVITPMKDSTHPEIGRRSKL